MAAKADQPSSDKGNPVTLIVGPASGFQSPSVRLASSVGSVKGPPVLQSGQTTPGTVTIGLPQANVSAPGRRKKAGGTEPMGNVTKQDPSISRNTLPSKYKVTPPQRMSTRSLKELPEKEPSKTQKRKLPSKSSGSNPDIAKSSKKGKASSDSKKEEKSGSNSKTISPKKSTSPKKGVATNQAIPKATARSRTSKSKLKVQSGSSTFDITVKCTPSESLPRQSSPNHNDHSYVYSPEEVHGLKARALKDAKLVEKLLRDRRMLRMRAFRANKKLERLMRAIELEQKMHKETRQTLRAITQGLQLQFKTE